MKWIAVGFSVTLFLSALAQAQTPKTIAIRDACDPDSFNAVVGPGTCIAGHHGNTLFEDFIAELQSDQIAGAWPIHCSMQRRDISIWSI
jgi:hypothetical protein